MTEPRELMMHELSDLLYAERQILKALPKMAKEAGDDKLKDGFTSHEEETREQISNLEEAFELLGEKAKAEPCPGILGIIAEHDEFMKEEKPEGEVRDLFLTGAALRVEHYEIAAYTGLIGQAEALGETKVVRLLKKNLAQEQKMAAAAEKLGGRLAKATT
jgi:Mn-containing catalase